MSDPTIEHFMTPAPHTIGDDQVVATAYSLMTKHGVRHLPVLRGGKLTGVVSKRDLLILSGLKDVEGDKLPVSEAMSQDVFTVGLSAKVREVAAEMAEHKYGCAIVADGTRVVGVFTTVDALRALSTLLNEAIRAETSTASGKVAVPRRGQ